VLLGDMSAQSERSCDVTLAAATFAHSASVLVLSNSQTPDPNASNNVGSYVTIVQALVSVPALPALGLISFVASVSVTARAALRRRAKHKRHGRAESG
jgi:hypothetical protein